MGGPDDQPDDLTHPRPKVPSPSFHPMANLTFDETDRL